MAWCTQCNQWNSDPALPCPHCGAERTSETEIYRRETDTTWYKIGGLLGIASGGTLGALIETEVPAFYAFLGALLGLFPGLMLGVGLHALSKTRQAIAIVGLLTIVSLLATFLR